MEISSHTPGGSEARPGLASHGSDLRSMSDDASMTSFTRAAAVKARTDPDLKPHRLSHFEGRNVGDPGFEIANCIQVVRDISVDMARQARGKDLR